MESNESGKNMKVGLIGLPTSGKTTVLNATSGGSAEVRNFAAVADTSANFAVVSVPDERQDWLREHYKPKKNVPATIELVDVAGMSSGGAKKEELSPQLLSNLRQVDALVNVIRAFENESVPHPSGAIDPLRDAQNLELELILADLSVVEKRLAKIDQEILRKKGTDKSKAEEEKDLLSRFNDHLSSEKALRTFELTADEMQSIRGYTFLSQKPLMIVANISESDLEKEDLPVLAKLSEWAKSTGTLMISFCAKVEMEIAQLNNNDPNEAKEFMDALGIKEASRDKVIRAAYTLLKQIAFFTVGEDEVRAWTLTRDASAQEAAGKIHSDIARGFIRAEVAAYSAIHDHGGWNQAKDKGLVRLEGKEYKVQDGDCINFRFNI